MNKKFEFLEHTADTKIRAYGETIEEAFSNALIATTTVMTNPELIKEKITKKIKIKAKNKKALLYDFLEEILFLLDTEQLLIKKTNNLQIKENQEEYELTTELIGDYAKNYEVHSTIKAITYSEMEIKQEKNKHVIQIVHDL
ncbi:archease [Candidatus Woesearchaeota archaeon]|nr:archease [Candidatus Woesearchaeota archaeon]